MENIRSRFAPSPTGYLHLGGARTALFNWLYARHHGGKFILRIEDTDVARSTAESTQEILDGLRWLGLDWDEGPYFQSERSSIYQEHIDKLIELNHAYRCVCSPEVLQEKRKKALAEKKKPKYDGTCRDRSEPVSPDLPHVVRSRTPEAGSTEFEDRIKGKISFLNSELDDLIIRRTDGTPTYNFVVVVDDITMGITDIIRGDDHINNTPRQILLYQALGYLPPRFAHVPMILGSDRTRLSKRHGATSVTAYREMGYLPEALMNYLARLGWSSGDQEIFSQAELIEKFNLDQVGKSAGIFNPEKLLWLNAHYIKTSPAEKIASLLPEYLDSAAKEKDSQRLRKIILSLNERSKTMQEMAQNAAFYFWDKIDYHSQLTEKFFTAEKLEIFGLLLEKIQQVDRWDETAIEELIIQVIDERKIRLKDIAQPLRVALTNSKVSPGIYEIMAILGKEQVKKRLAYLISDFHSAKT
jgi:glutamyl-tRNA synthetase